MRELSVVHAWMSAAVIERLGWMLLHSLWQFAGLAVMAAMMMHVLRRRSAVLRHNWLAAILTLCVISPLVTWFVLPDIQPVDSGKQIRPATDTGDAAKTTLFVQNDDPAIQNRSIDDRFSKLSRSVVPVMETESPSNPSPKTPASHSWPQRVDELLRPWWRWIVGGWFMGVMICALRPALGWWTLRRLKSVGVTAVSADVAAALKRMSAQLGLQRAVRILDSALTQAPIVVGYLRPVVLLPIGLAANIPLSQLEAILAHELAHVRRHDFLVNLLQTLVETLFFYHPAVWWLSRQIRLEREHCCDDLVVASLGNRVEYGRALLAIEERRGPRTALALGATNGSLVARIRRLGGLDPDQMSDRWSPALLGVTGLSVILLFSATWTLVAKDMDKPKSQPVIVELPGGVTVELVGVGATAAEDVDHCWGPDGGELKESAKWPKVFSPPVMETTHDLFLRISGLKNRKKIGYANSGMRQWSQIPSERAIHRVAILANDPVFHLQLGITDEEWGPWQSVSTTGDLIGEIDIPSSHEFVYGEITPVHVEIREGQTGLCLDNIQGKRLAIVDVIAIDQDGAKHRPFGSSLWGHEDPVHLDLFKLPVANIDRFEYRLLPYRYWITFENISLNPGKKTDVTTSVRKIDLQGQLQPLGAEEDQHSENRRDLESAPFVVQLPGGKSLELVGVTKNTAPAEEGWQPNGLPLENPGHWPATTVLHRIDNGWSSTGISENSPDPKPKPDESAIDYLFRWRGLKEQPSFIYRLPSDVAGYSSLPLKDPYEIRIAGRNRGEPPSGESWNPPNDIMHIGFTDESWGRYVKIGLDGEVIDPIQPEERFSSTYALINVRGITPSKDFKLIVIDEPNGHADPNDDFHRYDFEFHAVDTDGNTHDVSLRYSHSEPSEGLLPGTNAGRQLPQGIWESKYSLSRDLPAGISLSHYEYRLRPIRHWITFENVSLEPGKKAHVKSSVRTMKFPGDQPAGAKEENNAKLPADEFQSVTYRQPKLAAKIPEESWSETVNRLRMALVLPNEVSPETDEPIITPCPRKLMVSPGQSLDLRLLFENSSEDDVDFSGFINVGNGQVELLDAEGVKLNPHQVHLGVYGVRDHWRLLPGERQVLAIDPVQFKSSPAKGVHEFGHFFDVAPGDYTLRCTFQSPDDHAAKREWSGTLTADLKLTVIEPAKADQTSDAGSEQHPRAESKPPIPNTGTLSGRFLFDGEPPAPRDFSKFYENVAVGKPLPNDEFGRVYGAHMGYLQYLQKHLKPKMEDRSLLIDPEGGIANVVVWVTSKNIPLTSHDELPPAVFQVKEGSFSPNVTVLQTGQALQFKNNDPLGVNIFIPLMKNDWLNRLLPPGNLKEPFTTTFDQAESRPIQVQSNIVMWSIAWLMIRENPYFAVSRPDGTFVIPNLPPGEWEFRVWHERSGYLKHWERGQFRQKIQLGENSLGTIKLKPEFFQDKKPADKDAP